MPLKVTLKPNEKIVINQSVIENGPVKAELVVLSKATILRDKEILTDADATSFGKTLYFLVQMMYLFPETEADRLPVLKKMLKPTLSKPQNEMKDLLEEIKRLIDERAYYKALRICKKVIQVEEDTPSHGHQQ